MGESEFQGSPWGAFQMAGDAAGAVWGLKDSQCLLPRKMDLPAPQQRSEVAGQGERLP